MCRSSYSLVPSLRGLHCDRIFCLLLPLPVPPIWIVSYTSHFHCHRSWRKYTNHYEKKKCQSSFIRCAPKFTCCRISSNGCVPMRIFYYNIFVKWLSVEWPWLDFIFFSGKYQICVSAIWMHLSLTTSVAQKFWKWGSLWFKKRKLKKVYIYVDVMQGHKLCLVCVFKLQFQPLLESVPFLTSWVRQLMRHDVPVAWIKVYCKHFMWRANSCV